MKKLLVFCLLGLGSALSARAQVSRTSLPIDSATQKVCYQGVVQVPNATQAELYSRAREWFATSFGSAKAVLEMDDKEAGKLVGNANSRYYEKYFGAQADMVLWRTINVQVKDGRFKYSIGSFAVGTYPHSQYDSTPIENYFTPAAFGKNGEPSKYIVQKIESVKQSGESQAVSLRAAMLKPASRSNW